MKETARADGQRRSALVLDGGSGQALEVVRSLGRAGWRVLAPRGTRSAVSRFTASQVAIPDAADPAALRNAVRAVLAAEPVDVIVPCSDASAQTLWDCEPQLLGAGILGGDRASFALAVDKAATLVAAERAGFPVPRFICADDLVETEQLAGELGLPFVVKPRRSFTLHDGKLVQRRHRFVRRPEELAGALAALGSPEGAPLVQAYVPGRSLSVSAVVRDGRLLARAARETFSFEPVAGGTSVWKRTIPPGDVGVEEACRLLVDLGVEGLAEVEYQVGADGVPRLMEIGARAHGWLGLAIAAGADLPLVAARALLGDDVEPDLRYRAGLEMRWPRGEVTRIKTALTAPGELPPDVSRAAVIAKSWPPWLPGMRYDGVDRYDLVPLFPERLRAVARPRAGPSDSRLRPGPSVVYPAKAAFTRARSIAWLVRRSEPAAGELRILFYHRVADDRDELAVTPRRFREQMQLLAEEGYRVVDVSVAASLLDAGLLPARTIGLSFDDGFRDVAEAALPVLEEHGFRATVFVCPDVIDGRARFDWYPHGQPPLLGWDELRVLDGGALRFEAHTLTHPNLTALTEDDARREIVGSKARLEARLGRPVEAFCYPAGLHGERERRLVAEAGFRVAVSCEPGPNRAESDRLTLRRQQVDARDGLLDFRAKLAGGHDSPPPARALYRRIRYRAPAGSAAR